MRSRRHWWLVTLVGAFAAAAVAVGALAAGLMTVAGAFGVVSLATLRVAIPLASAERQRRRDEAERDVARRAQQGDPAALAAIRDKYTDLATAMVGGNAPDALNVLEARLGRYDTASDVSFGAFVVAVFHSITTDR